MPITISYDLTDVPSNDRTYIRSALERFGWKRLGGSTFRFPADLNSTEDWLNKVIPSLMFFRSYLVGNGHKIKFFTLDSHSFSLIDQSDSEGTAGCPPVAADDIQFLEPTNLQASLKTLQDFIRGADSAAKK